MNLPLPVNHIFVDFENVQEIDLSVLGQKAVSFTLLLGPKQTKLGLDIVEKLLQHAGSVEMIRLASAGRNALDFTLAYYVGRAVAADPCGFFHIIAKDKDYDPMIEHLRSRHIRIRRHEDFTTLTFPAATPSAPPTAPPNPIAAPKPKPVTVLDDRKSEVREHLRKAAANRPKTKKKLVTHLVAHLGHKVTEAEVESLIEALRQAGHLAIDGKGAVTYRLDRK